MRTMKNFMARFMAVGSILVIYLVSFPLSAWAQDYPNKPITLYCSYVAGATTDITARALACGRGKTAGSSRHGGKQTGGNSTVCASLLASKKPDGYTLGGYGHAG